MTSSAFPLIPARHAALDLGSTAWLFGFSLVAFASLLPLRLLEQRGVVGIHWIHCTAIVALTALVAAIVIRARAYWPRQNQELVYALQRGSPTLPAPETAVLPKPDVVTTREGSDQLTVIEGIAAEHTGAALALLRVQHQLRDPLHHALMIVRDLETIGGSPDRLERVRSLRTHIDEISRTVGEGDVRSSFAARFEEWSSRSEVRT